MSDLPQRLRLNATIPLVMEAAARIEALEAECDRWAEQANTTAASLRTKVKALEAALRQSVDDWRKRGRRIEALEAALRGIIQTLESLNDTKRASFYKGSVVNELTMALDIARAALDQSSPPSATK